MQYLAALLIILVAVAAVSFVERPDLLARLGLIEQHERIDGREHADPQRVPRAGQPGPQLIRPGQFDIAKIDPDGTSVFAGRSTPNSIVTIFADGVAIGTATTDGNGEWVLVTERHVSNPDPKLSIQVGPSQPVSPPSPPKANSGHDVPSAASVSANLMDELRFRVERARADADQRAAAASEKLTDVAQRHDVVAQRPLLETQITPAPQHPIAKTGGDVFPIPIKFIFREAAFTEDGRKAAKLLLEYLLLSRPPSIKMSGHADERGEHDFNMNLSADRLETVVKYLRAGGYTGQVELIPKGDTEPFAGIDRTRIARDELYELDRRVELKIAQ
jgi:outer membrane protein OmpA-like peptidoglycan-associated protein